MNVNMKRTLSSVTILIGIVAMAFALYLDFSGSKNTMRGTILVVGALLGIWGIYSFPTKKHRIVINVFIFISIVVYISNHCADTVYMRHFLFFYELEWN